MFFFFWGGGGSLAGTYRWLGSVFSLDAKVPRKDDPFLKVLKVLYEESLCRHMKVLLRGISKETLDCFGFE